MKAVLPAPPNSMKIKTMVRSPVLRHLFHVLRLLTKAKSLLVDLLNKNKTHYYDKHKRIKKKSLYGSIRLHYNWCSSHVRPMPDPAADGAYYDATWNSVVDCDGDGDGESGPALTPGTLPHWLQEEKPQVQGDGDVEDEINRLAEVFIANCHEKFRLEKQESYRHLGPAAKLLYSFSSCFVLDSVLCAICDRISLAFGNSVQILDPTSELF
ncbi:hypothetical protein H6P81_001202 [Aristolochia fimbriata]|uniref:Uncharacterized protein n=1 Tax=Aristolochia fimbriata TaxID=158543 RepID=A0AAV7F7Q4_ARIFI|nr:hypothetical protein H6P81_001202 [Aristolochia fimbriata]